MIGTAVQSGQLKRPEATALILKQFNSMTPEYEFMPSILHPAPDIFDFKAADQIVKFALDNDLKLTGHMLCWHLMTPQWMFEDENHKPLPRELALANLKKHIDTVVAHFKGQLESWNVVNEAISDEPGEYMRDTAALRAIGPDYVQKAFEFAHQADPNVPLYYNDYNVEDSTKLPKVLQLIRSLRKAGVRLDGVGIQGHWLLTYPPAETIDAGIQTLAKEGLKVIITELDVDVVPRNDSGDPFKAGIPANVQELEAKRYAGLFKVFLKHSDVIPRVTFWGLEDGQSWLNTNPKKHTNYPLLFDRKLNSKPCYDAIVAELSR